jgi:hypothetical protein
MKQVAFSHDKCRCGHQTKQHAPLVSMVTWSRFLGVCYEPLCRCQLFAHEARVEPADMRQSQ